MYLGGTAIAAASLAVGVGSALAASPSTANTKVLKCHVNLTTGAPWGTQAVNVPPLQGTQYGPARCGGQFGGGIEADSFKIPDSGDMLGPYAQYFSTGSLHGKFDMQPLTGLPPSSTSFESQAWSGTVTVTGGSGAYANDTGKKGTLKCNSPDSVHYRCTERITLTLGS